MKEIPLTRGKTAWVDDAAFDFLMQWKWHAVQPNPDNGTFYAARRQWVGPRRYVTVYMHQVVAGFQKPDHKDGNGLNNCRDNLRHCSLSQNRANVNRYKNNRAGFKGVWFDARARAKKWAASLRLNGKHLYAGRFSTAREAAVAYDTKARELFGEFAKTNADLGLL